MSQYSASGKDSYHSARHGDKKPQDAEGPERDLGRQIEDEIKAGVSDSPQERKPGQASQKLVSDHCLHSALFDLPRS